MATNLFDEMVASIGAAVNDVREKVVEEPWYGTTLSTVAANEETMSPALTLSDATAPSQSNMFDEAVASIPQQPGTQDIGHDSPSPGGDMDR